MNLPLWPAPPLPARPLPSPLGPPAPPPAAPAGAGGARPQPLPPGTTLGRGRYTIEGIAGYGGFGYVYLARDRWGQPLAVKQCTDLTSEGLMQFGHEGAVQKILHHAAFVRVYAQFVERLPGTSPQDAAEALFTVMEYVPGRALEDLLAERLQRGAGPFPEAEVLAWAAQLLDALQHAHAVGVIHRDIKPSNLLLLPDGRTIKVIDFGIAKIGGAGAHTLRAARGVSPPYSPPEQYAQTGQTDAYSDVYAVGATLYHLLTGHAPVDAPVRQSGKTLVPPRGHNPALSPAFEAVILRAMQLDVAARYQTAGEMLGALPAILRGPAPAQRKPKPRALSLRLLLALALTSLGAGLVLSAYAGRLTPGGAMPLDLVSPELVPGELANWEVILGELVPRDFALALAPLRSVLDTAATRTASVAAMPTAPPPTVETALRTPGPARTAGMPAAVPSATPTATRTATPTPSPTPSPAATATPIPTATPNASATAAAFQQQIELAVAATLTAQPTAVPQPPIGALGGGAQNVAMLGVVDGGPEGGLVNLRSGPGTNSGVLLGVNTGEEVLVLGRNQNGSWLQVRIANGTQGWMSALYIRTGGPVDSYPVVAP